MCGQTDDPTQHDEETFMADLPTQPSKRDAAVATVIEMGLDPVAIATAFAPGRLPENETEADARDVDDLSAGELRLIVAEVRGILWAGDDPDHEWTSSTIEHVAQVLIDRGLRPPERFPLELCNGSTPECPHYACPDGWHPGDAPNCSCTPDCALDDDGNDD